MVDASGTRLRRPMQRLQQPERRDDHGQIRPANSFGIRNGWNRPDAIAVVEQLLVADRKQRTTQRREHR